MLAVSEQINTLYKPPLMPLPLCFGFCTKKYGTLQTLTLQFIATQSTYTNEGDISNSRAVTGVKRNPTVPDRLHFHLYPPLLSSSASHLRPSTCQPLFLPGWLSVCWLAQSVGLFLCWHDSIDCRIVMVVHV